MIRRLAFASPSQMITPSHEKFPPSFPHLFQQWQQLASRTSKWYLRIKSAPEILLARRLKAKFPQKPIWEVTV